MSAFTWSEAPSESWQKSCELCVLWNVCACVCEWERERALWMCFECACVKNIDEMKIILYLFVRKNVQTHKLTF